MLEAINTISLQQLQKVTYECSLPFQLQSSGQIIICHQLIRVVPGKRLVFIGSYNNDQFADEKVIIKLFVHPSRAKKHWLRECDGTKLLNDNEVLTPEQMAQGVSDEGIYFLLFRFIQGQNLALFWKKTFCKETYCKENGHFVREQKLREVLCVLEKHHRSGLAHQDLHYANFLLGNDEQIYTLDGEEVKSCSAPLKKSLRLNNLALFLAQTFDLSQSSSLSLLKHYIKLSSIPLDTQDEESFWELIRHYHQQRINQYLKKILRECTEVVYEKTQAGYSFCRRDYHHEIQKLLQQPEHFFQHESSNFLKQGHTCTVKSVWINNKRYVIKRYNPKGIVYELTHMGQISRARKSWINAHLLRFMGILTPEPIALIEQNAHLAKRCRYFISRYTEGQSSWDFFCDKNHSDDDKQVVADKLLSTFKQLCDHKISHGDLKGSNFLIHKNKVWVLDLDALTQYKTNGRFEKSWQRDKQRFLKNWCKKSCYEPWKQYFNQSFETDFI